MRQFTAGAVLDVRLARSQLSFSEEKVQRQIEIRAGHERSMASGRASYVIGGKFLCLEGYCKVTGVPRSSGSHKLKSFIHITLVQRIGLEHNWKAEGLFELGVHVFRPQLQ